MPDTQGRRGLPGEVFKQNVAKLAAPPPVSLKGGIISPDNYKSFVVNIRPRNWQDRFWIGQIDNYVDAQFIAEAVYYYTGRASFHLKDASFKFPPLECSDSGTSTLLTDREMCLKYASSIAKGNEFKIQRSNFREKVKKLALDEVKSAGVQRLLLQFRGKSGSAAIPVEGVAGNDDDDDDGGHPTPTPRHPTPMEVDGQSEQETHLSKLVPSSHDRPEAVDRHVEGGNAHVPGFDINFHGFTLRSDLTPVDEFAWVEAYLGSLKDGDSEDHHESFNNDKEDFCSATRDLERNSFGPTHCPSAFENFGTNFFIEEDAWID